MYLCFHLHAFVSHPVDFFFKVNGTLNVIRSLEKPTICAYKKRFAALSRRFITLVNFSSSLLRLNSDDISYNFLSVCKLQYPPNTCNKKLVCYPKKTLEQIPKRLSLFLRTLHNSWRFVQGYLYLHLKASHNIACKKWQWRIACATCPSLLLEGKVLPTSKTSGKPMFIYYHILPFKYVRGSTAGISSSNLHL